MTVLEHRPELFGWFKTVPVTKACCSCVVEVKPGRHCKLFNNPGNTEFIVIVQLWWEGSGCGVNVTSICALIETNTITEVDTRSVRAGHVAVSLTFPTTVVIRGLTFTEIRWDDTAGWKSSQVHREEGVYSRRHHHSPQISNICSDIPTSPKLIQLKSLFYFGLKQTLFSWQMTLRSKFREHCPTMASQEKSLMKLCF